MLRAHSFVDSRMSLVLPLGFLVYCFCCFYLQSMWLRWVPKLDGKSWLSQPPNSAALVRNHNMAVLAVFPPWVFLNITTFPTFKQWPANLGQTQMLGVISSQCNLLFRGTYCSCRRWLTLAIDIVCRCTSSVLQVEVGSLRIEWLLHRLLPQIWNLFWRQV